MAITNYLELKTQIAKWLDRSDLTAQIPDFVQLAEDMIFRRLRCPGNEQMVVYPASATDVPTDAQGPGIPATFVNTVSVEIPNDFLQAKLLMYNNIPLERISDQRFGMQNAAVINGAIPAGMPAQFARLKDEFYFFPPADSNEDVTLWFYESQGPLVNDDDWTRTLRYAPGLYLFGSLMQAQAYLIGDERIPVWAQQFEAIMESCNGQTDDDEVSGSTTSVRSIY